MLNFCLEIPVVKPFPDQAQSSTITTIHNCTWLFHKLSDLIQDGFSKNLHPMDLLRLSTNQSLSKQMYAIVRLDKSNNLRFLLLLMYLKYC